VAVDLLTGVIMLRVMYECGGAPNGRSGQQGSHVGQYSSQKPSTAHLHVHVSAASSVPKTIRVPVASLTSNQQHDCMRLAKHRPRSLLPHTKAHPEVGLAAPHNLPQHPFSWNKDQHSISKQTTASTPLITEFWWWIVPCGLFACAVQHYTAHAS
jgi:hypothetical protein